MKETESWLQKAFNGHPKSEHHLAGYIHGRSTDTRGVKGHKKQFPEQCNYSRETSRALAGWTK